MIRALVLAALLLLGQETRAAVGLLPLPGSSTAVGCTYVNLRAGSFSTWSALWSSQQANDTLTVTGTCSNSSVGGVGSAGITLNSSAGVTYTGGNSQGIFDIFGSGFTISGGTILGPVRVRDNAKNITLKNGVINGIPGCYNLGTSCILTGAFNGTVTIINFLVYLGGQGSGQNHNVYVSASGRDLVDATCEAINGLTSLNSIDEGWLLKIRAICSSGQQGVTTKSVIATTISSANPNGPIDYPCGGNHAVTHSVIENAFNQSRSAGWYMIKYGEEVGAVPSGCPSNVGQVNTVVLDGDIIMNDASGNGSGFESILCTQAGTGGSPTHCLPSALPGYSATMTNSVVVGNLSGAGYMINAGGFTDSNVGCTLSAGKCTDANNNRWYQDRAAAAANEGWSGNYTDPSTGTVTPCCAWPWLPAHL